MRYTRRGFKLSYMFFIGFLLVAILAPGTNHSSHHYVKAQSPNDLPTCATNESEIEGQEWEVTGGTLNATLNPLPPDEVVDYADIARQFGNGLSIDPLTFEQPVVILVVDEFHTLKHRLAHGQNVIEATSSMLLAARTQFEIPKDKIILDRVEVLYEDVPGMVQLIDTALTHYIPSDPNDDDQPRFVLNMSFNLIPCTHTLPEDNRYNLPQITFSYYAFKEMYNTSDEGDYSLIQYVEDTLTDDAESTPDNTSFLEETHALAREIVYDWVSNSNGATLADPLHEYLQNLQNPQNDLYLGFTVIPVASAGNYGTYGYVDPFAPASWPEVIAVSSTTTDPTQLSEFSNVGAIKAPGEWHFNPVTNEYLRGTSFAAPMVSVWIAVMESSSAITCDFDIWKSDKTSNIYFSEALLVSTTTAACTLTSTSTPTPTPTP